MAGRFGEAATQRSQRQFGVSTSVSALELFDFIYKRYFLLQLPYIICQNVMDGRVGASNTGAADGKTT